MDTSYAFTVKFDMMRVRENGWIVPRHNAGMLRAVRGVLIVHDEHLPELNRRSRMAKFNTDQGEMIRMFDVALMHASSDRIVLSGFERTVIGTKNVDFAQTWVLVDCEGEAAEATRGPPFTS